MNLNEEDIQCLLRSIFNIKYDWTSSGSRYTSDAIAKEARTLVEQSIRQFLLEKRDKYQGELEAKVFVYEEIIKKSNFAPMIENKNRDINQEEETNHAKD